MKHLGICLAAFLALGGGCATPTEGDRQLVDQNEKAGAYIETTASEPGVKQAGRDVRENSTTLKKNLTGEPKQPQPYSPQASAAAREQSTQEHSSPWWKTALTILLSAIGGGGLAGIGARLLGGPAATALQAVVQGVINVRQKAAGGMLTADVVLDELKKAQEAAGVQPFVAGLAKKIEAKLGLKL